MLLWLILGVSALLLVVELYLRFGLGLGDPPVYQLHPDIEYLHTPGTYHRFHNRIRYNRFHMRGPEITEIRTDPQELRILVIGDSISNAGPRLDDSQVGTVLLEQRLHHRLDRPVRVLNIGASSWGPLNQLAYVRTFGVFDADAAVLVYNCSDIGDQLPPPPGTPMLGYDHPTRRPILAVQELLQKYVPRALGINAGTITHDTTNPPEEIRAYNAKLVADLVEFLRGKGLQVAAVVEWMASEIENGPTPGTLQMTAVLQGLGVPTLQTRDDFAAAMAGGRRPFLPRDEAHPNALGQAILAGLMDRALRSVGIGR